MKIVDFKEFAAMPAGTIFSYYEPHNCEGLFRKGDTIHNDKGEARDFWEASLVPWCVFDPDTLRLDDTEGRWAMYEYDQQFAVLETQDIANLRAMLPA